MVANVGLCSDGLSILVMSMSIKEDLIERFFGIVKNKTKGIAQSVENALTYRTGGSRFDPCSDLGLPTVFLSDNLYYEFKVAQKVIKFIH